MHTHTHSLPPLSLTRARTNTHSEMLIPLSLALLTSVQWDNDHSYTCLKWKSTASVGFTSWLRTVSKSVIRKITLSLYINTAGSGVLQCPCIFYISVTNSEAHTLFISRITLWIWTCKAYNTHESRRLYSSSATDKNHTYWHMGNVMTTDLYRLVIH
jgi:hypothetical protein